MAHSIESRLPFLDYRLVSLAFTVEPNWQMRGPWNKFVLREAMRGRIPDSVRNRMDKMGFPVPSKNWLAGALYAPVRDLIASQHVRERGIYNIDSIALDLERHRRKEIDVSWEVFNIAQFEAWSAL
jgi:asparagine synthase (glutamine-hydrolysing)